jgi:aspartokinase/homoserine dehydrogenase 1
VPPTLRDGSVEAYLAAIDATNDAWAARIEAAARHGKTLQYIGTLDADGLRVGVREVAPDSPFVRLRGTDNMILFTTGRYNASPLVIQGPGAGPDVTAAGILADVIKAAELVS